MTLRTTALLLFLIGMGLGVSGCAELFPSESASSSPPSVPAHPTAGSSDLEIVDAEVRHHRDLGLLRFEQRVNGTAGGTRPEPHGNFNGAPVLGYVFPTTLAPDAVGFASVEGTLALAVTAHPDFDDTPLWDENDDGNPHNDGAHFHSHWVVLVPDERVQGGLRVKELGDRAADAVLPASHPDLPLYLDSPGFPVRLRQDSLAVLLPTERVDGRADFRYGAVTAYLQVDTAPGDRPTLGVYKVYRILSGDLSLPFDVRLD